MVFCFRDAYETLANTNVEGLDIFWWDKAKCEESMGGDTPFCCGLGQAQAGQMWPAKLVFGILQSTLDMGNLKVYTQTKVSKTNLQDGEYEGDEERPEIWWEMEKGGEKGRISCNVVVYAVNAWIPTLIPSLADVVHTLRGQVVVTSPIPTPLLKDDVSLALGFVEEDEDEDGGESEGEKKEIEGEIKKSNKKKDPKDDWDDEEDLFYMIRRKKDQRVVVGKRVPKELCKDEYDDSAADPETTKKLQHFLEENFSAMKRTTKEGQEEADWRIEFEWQGIMGFTEDENPIVGRIPKKMKMVGRISETVEPEDGHSSSPPSIFTTSYQKNQYVVGGFSGDGMAKAFASAKAIADMIVGKLAPEDFIPSFSPGRFSTKCTNSYLL